jgi:hypothetical protein
VIARFLSVVVMAAALTACPDSGKIGGQSDLDTSSETAGGDVAVDADADAAGETLADAGLDADAVADAGADALTDVDALADADAAADADSDSGPDLEADAEVDADATEDSLADADAADVADEDSVADTDALTDADALVDAASDSDAVTDADSAPDADNDVSSSADSEADADEVSVVDAIEDAGPDGLFDAEPDLELDAEPETLLDAEPEILLDAEPDAEPDAETDLGLDSELDSEPDAELDAELDAEPDIELDAEPEILLDAEPDLEIDDSADLPDDSAEDTAPDVDAGPVPTLLPPPCQRRAPAILYDSAVLTDELGLSFALLDSLDDPLTLATWNAGESPTSPLSVTDPGAVAEIFVALDGPDGCRISAHDSDGAPVWSVPYPLASCQQPVGVDGVLLIALDELGTGRIALLATDGSPLTDLELPATVRTSPVRLGGDSGVIKNGGSHWLVGLNDRVAAIRYEALPEPTLSLVGSFPTPGLQVTALVPLDDGLIGASARAGLAYADTLGDRLLRISAAIDLTGVQLASAGPPIIAPGPITALPVGGFDCTNPLANGGSHWWCPGGVLVAGGLHWLAAWDLTTGIQRFESPVADTLVTGISLGHDGWIYNGGSHWLGGPEETLSGGWRLHRLDPLAPTPTFELLMSADDADALCLSSPVVDTAGLLAAQIERLAGASGLARLPGQAGGLAPGYARAGGTNENASRRVTTDDPCPGDDSLFFSRRVDDPIDAILPSCVTTLPGDDLAVGGLATDALSEHSPWLARVNRRGYTVWRFAYSDGSGQEAPLEAVALTGGVLVTGHNHAPALGVAATRFLGIDPLDGALLWETVVGGSPERLLQDIAPLPGGAALAVGSVSPSAATPDQVFVVRLDAGGVDQPEIIFGEPALSLKPEAIAARADGAGYVIVGTITDPLGGVPSVFIRAFDAAGASVWSDTVFEALNENLGEDVQIGPDGRVYVLGRVFSGTKGLSTGWLRVYAPDGTPLGVESLPTEAPQSLVQAPTGDLFAVGDAFDVVRLNSDGAAGELLFRAPVSPNFAAAAAAFSDGGFAIVGITQVDPADSPDGIIVRASWDSADGCARAGRCVGTVAADCDDADPCTEDRCDPATGACTHVGYDDNTPCGASLTCQSGVCE